MSWLLLNRFTLTGRKKNVLKTLFLQKTLDFIKSELELFDFRVKYPEEFNQSDRAILNSDFHLVADSKVFGILGMTEIVLSLQLSGEILDKNGKPVNKMQLAKHFEKMFNFSYDEDFYKKIATIFKRTKCDHTKGMDYLRTLLTREIKQKITLKKENEKK